MTHYDSQWNKVADDDYGIAHSSCLHLKIQQSFRECAMYLQHYDYNYHGFSTKYFFEKTHSKTEIRKIKSKVEHAPLCPNSRDLFS